MGIIVALVIIILMIWLTAVGFVTNISEDEYWNDKNMAEALNYIRNNKNGDD